MIPEDVFVYDCVVHAHDMSDANLLDGPDAGVGRSSILRLGEGRAPGSSGGHDAFDVDWPLDELYDMVFVQSRTSLAMAQTVPIFDWFRDGFAPVRAQYELAQRYPDRVQFCGGVDPSFHGDGVIEEMHRQVTELGSCSFKFYNAHVDGRTWRCDDEAVAYPMYETARDLGIELLQFHKGVPFGTQNMEDLRPNDLQRAARDFPDMTFLIHHLALPYFDEVVSIAARFPNIYLALSGNVALLFSRPREFYAKLGQLLAEVGSHKLLWGSEASLMGVPQVYIDAFWDAQMPEDLQDGYGFPPITEDDKRAILGLNFARIMGVDPAGAPPPVDGAASARA